MNKPEHVLHNSECMQVKWMVVNGGMMNGKQYTTKRPKAYCKLWKAYVVPTDKPAVAACDKALTGVR